VSDRQRLHELVRPCVKHGRFVLSSGKTSDFYFDAKEVTLTPEGSYLTARLMLDDFIGPDVTAVGGLTAGADPIVSAIGVVSHTQGRQPPLKLFYVRKEPKKHGTAKYVEGPPLARDDRVVIVEDVVTTGKSAREAIERVRSEAGCEIVRVVALVDRLEGGARGLEPHELRSIFTREHFPGSAPAGAGPGA